MSGEAPRVQRLATSDKLVGKVLQGRYRITERIGSGGMGSVYAAVQEALGREVAIKVMRPHVADVPEAIARFEREARTLARINHPNVVTVHDFGSLEGSGVYLVMERLQGETLASMLSRGPLPWAQAARVIRDVARALACAHKEGVVHRDLKPENVMLLGSEDEGDLIKVLDFGVARIMDAGQEEKGPVTGTGVLLGTPGYMAPEVMLDGVANEPRSDLYSLGLVWAETLSGFPVYQATTPAAALVKQATEAPPAIETLPAAQDMPAELKDLYRALLQREPADRPADAATVARVLDDVERGLGSRAGWMAPLHIETSASRGRVSSAAHGAPGTSLPPSHPTEREQVPPEPPTETDAEGVFASLPSGDAPRGDDAPAGPVAMPGGSADPDEVSSPGQARPSTSPTWVAAFGVSTLAAIALGVVVWMQDSADAPAPKPPPPMEPASTSPPKTPPAPPPPPAADDDEKNAAAPTSAAGPAEVEDADQGEEEEAPAQLEEKKPPKAKRARRKARRRRRRPSASRGRGKTSGRPAEGGKEAKGPPALTSALIDRAIRKSFGSAQACTNTNIKSPPRGPGILVDHCPSYTTLDKPQHLTIRVKPTGEVVAARFRSQEANTSKIGRCIRASIKKWRFPAFRYDEGETVEISQTVRFKPCVPINGKCVF